ncbi:MAG: Zn-ribbon containing protein [Candidatus Woesearchaeota archaeon]
MPHQCVRCNQIYDDGSSQILKGCDCGGKFFFYIKKSALEKKEKEIKKLNQEEREQIEKDACDIIGVDIDELKHPVILDLETIHILQPGKFEVDLVKLFNKKNPLVYKLEEGKYMIDIAESFKRDSDNKKGM